MDASTAQLLQTLRWSSNDGETPFDQIKAKLSAELIEQLRADFASFRDALGGDFDPTVYYNGCHVYNYHLEHDYIMTRNHHGCGFWDGDWEEPWATRLTDTCRELPMIEIYVGDDGLIYAA
jgi:hypothetical protein